jgi:hypothetical protein
MTTQSVVVPVLSDATAFPEALARVEAEMLALTEEELLVVNLDVTAAVTTVLGKWPALVSLRPQILEQLPKFDLARFDRLPDYARALWQTHALHHKALPSTTPLQELADEGAKLRELLLSDVTALVRRGLLKEEFISDVMSPVSYRGLAQALSSLAGALRANWSRLAGKTAVVEAELDRANAVSHQLVMAVSEREQLPIVQAVTAQNRQRAYTLFMRAYADAQRAVRFLREEHGDMEEFTPSLFAGRGGGNIRRKEEAQAPVTPAPSVMPSAPTQGITLPSVNTGQGAPIGMPGSNPLI